MHAVRYIKQSYSLLWTMDHHTSLMWKKYLLEKGFDTLLNFNERKGFFELKNINQIKNYEIFSSEIHSAISMFQTKPLQFDTHNACLKHPCFWCNLMKRKRDKKKPFCVRIYVRFWYLSSITLLSDSLYSNHWSDYEDKVVQYGHFIPAPVVRTSSSACLYKNTSRACQH